jgi:peroxiredoxin
VSYIRRMDRRTAVLCLALSPVVARAFAAEALAAGRAVDPWRDRVLVGPDGKTTSLAAHAAGGRLVVVTLKGHWCSVCLGQLARLGALRDRLVALKARVIGLNADSRRANAEAAKEVGIPFPILSDREHRVLDVLGLWRADAGEPMPAIVVYDECGRERGRLVGRQPGQSDERPLLELLEKIARSPPGCRGEANV